jgi:hypothetical protein
MRLLLGGSGQVTALTNPMALKGRRSAPYGRPGCAAIQLGSPLQGSASIRAVPRRRCPGRACAPLALFFAPGTPCLPGATPWAALGRALCALVYRPMICVAVIVRSTSGHNRRPAGLARYAAILNPAKTLMNRAESRGQKIADESAPPPRRSKCRIWSPSRMSAAAQSVRTTSTDGYRLSAGLPDCGMP